jgi:PKD repeat protein
MSTARRLLVLVLVASAATAPSAILGFVAEAHPPGPTASFTYAPVSPQPGETVTFTSTSAPGTGHPPIWAAWWDLDNDGSYDDHFGVRAQRSFASAGSSTVRLRVLDSHGQEAVASDVVLVGNQPPTASFVHRPEKPLAGETISLFSTSTDPESGIESQSWDLDGDGSFDDASGPVASLSFPRDGIYSVGLQILDGEGSSAVTFKTFVVAARGTAVSTQDNRLRILSPFPVVRMVGSIKRTGIRIKRLTVRAPVGATVTIHCRGRGCPFRRERTTAVARPAPKGQKPLTGLIRVWSFQRRLLRAGVIIKVFITKSGAVGKFTQFRIRRRAGPARADRCLVPGVTTPVPCPAAL